MRETAGTEGFAMVKQHARRPREPYSAENRSASTDEVFEIPGPRRKKLERGDFGGRGVLELAKNKTGGPRMLRGAFASVWSVALVGDGPRALLQAASR